MNSLTDVCLHDGARPDPARPYLRHLPSTIWIPRGLATRRVRPGSHKPGRNRSPDGQLPRARARLDSPARRPFAASHEPKRFGPLVDVFTMLARPERCCRQRHQSRAHSPANAHFHLCAKPQGPAKATSSLTLRSRVWLPDRNGTLPRASALRRYRIDRCCCTTTVYAWRNSGSNPGLTPRQP
jgi:hypothetical protein